MKATQNLTRLIGRFRNRLPQDVIHDALEYVEFNEPRLAFHILYIQLYEFEVGITANELWLFKTVGEQLQYAEFEPKEADYLEILERLVEHPTT